MVYRRIYLPSAIKGVSHRPYCLARSGVSSRPHGRRRSRQAAPWTSWSSRTMRSSSARPTGGSRSHGANNVVPLPVIVFVDPQRPSEGCCCGILAITERVEEQPVYTQHSLLSAEKIGGYVHDRRGKSLSCSSSVSPTDARTTVPVRLRREPHRGL
jgi:hypothetical protein